LQECFAPADATHDLVRHGRHPVLHERVFFLLLVEVCSENVCVRRGLRVWVAHAPRLLRGMHVQFRGAYLEFFAQLHGATFRLFDSGEWDIWDKMSECRMQGPFLHTMH
jgi:hypothetical protein